MFNSVTSCIAVLYNTLEACCMTVCALLKCAFLPEDLEENPMYSVSRGRRNPFVGPMSQDLWEKAHSVPSAYHDTFDYRIYDRLYDRFGAAQPRGRRGIQRHHETPRGAGWSNRADCCDAVGNVPAFQTTCASLPIVSTT
jgi:hypothetical protein